jgi:hypothetical protein
MISKSTSYDVTCDENNYFYLELDNEKNNIHSLFFKFCDHNNNKINLDIANTYLEMFELLDNKEYPLFVKRNMSYFLYVVPFGENIKCSENIGVYKFNWMMYHHTRKKYDDHKILLKFSLPNKYTNIKLHLLSFYDDSFSSKLFNCLDSDNMIKFLE